MLESFEVLLLAVSCSLKGSERALSVFFSDWLFIDLCLPERQVLSQAQCYCHMAQKHHFCCRNLWLKAVIDRF